MLIGGKREAILLLIGDVLFFLIALWLTLTVRTFTAPTANAFYNHLEPFVLLALAWIAVFFITGLYDKHTALFKQRLPSIILNAQVANIVIAALFFFLIPYFGITPKLTLFIYLIISSLLIVVWRLYLFPLLGIRRKEKTLVLGSGEELNELTREIHVNPRYNLRVAQAIDLNAVDNVDLLQEELAKHIDTNTMITVIADTRSEKLGPFLPLFYNLAFLHVRLRFLDFHKVYESVFSRVPLSLLRYSWVLENISLTPKVFHDVIKRVIDIVSAIMLGIPSLIAYPCVWAAIRLGGPGALFIVQERVGKNNRMIHIVKFRTMTGDDKGSEVLASKNTVTRVGNILRKTRIDELPQLWNILKGDISFIGPRPELPALVTRYEEEIPYYNVRHVIQPGLSGWAQIYHDRHPHHGTDVEATREKLSYDLYYIKNRSLVLDAQIFLKTIKTLLSRSGA
jgi:exopolysaccharide biosynthesis polyprenyl glycosylphosphotransferase|tara:strand:- start:3998 stop:5356 length:1359 start_codon:yes stop_codon:yes gene_type:complete